MEELEQKMEREERGMREIRKGITAAGACSLFLAALKLAGTARWGWIVVFAPLTGALLAAAIITISGSR